MLQLRAIEYHIPSTQLTVLNRTATPKNKKRCVKYKSKAKSNWLCKMVIRINGMYYSLVLRCKTISYFLIVNIEYNSKVRFHCQLCTWNVLLLTLKKIWTRLPAENRWITHSKYMTDREVFTFEFHTIPTLKKIWTPLPAESRWITHSKYITDHLEVFHTILTLKKIWTRLPAENGWITHSKYKTWSFFNLGVELSPGLKIL